MYKALKKVKVFSIGPMEIPTEATFLTTTLKDMGFIDGGTGNITKEPGKKTKCMARAFLFILMVAATKATTETAKSTVSAHFAS